MKRVLVLNGPNLNLLGEREVTVYGTETLDALCSRLEALGRELGLAVECRQSNHEGELLDWIHQARGMYAALIVNPGGLSHTSVALLDGLRAFPGMVVEVHLSNLWKREPFRQNLVTAAAADGVIAGLGGLSYELALRAVAQRLKENDSPLSSI